jgi:hypothetical protein
MARTLCGIGQKKVSQRKVSPWTARLVLGKSFGGMLRDSGSVTSPCGYAHSTLSSALFNLRFRSRIALPPCRKSRTLVKSVGMMVYTSLGHARCSEATSQGCHTSG